ncbi:MAG: hypothetical protein IKR11_05370 [Solobacterium sp.]|nr:hypothetical protein [Solobacterium sp.]
MRRRHSNSDFFWILILIFVFGGGSVFPLLLILGAVLAITMAAVNSSKKQESQNMGYQNGYTRTRNYYRTTTRNGYSPSQMAKVNVYLRNWYRARRYLPIGSNIDLRIHGQRYASLASLDVYRDGTYICSLNDFGRRYPDSYNEILAELVRMSEQQAQPEVFEAEVVETPAAQKQEVRQETKQEEAKPQEKKKSASDFMEEINRLNENIPDEDITNGLHETYSLLKQINTLEQRFPDSKDKLKKLYEYYLPILIRILRQYVNLQAAKSDPSYEDTRQKLNRTIKLINDAMKTIISSLTDQDFINLAADISTLEAVLQKDGLTNEGKMTQSKG